MVLTQPKQSTRDLILDATGRLLGRYGFRKMTMDDVAKEAGVSKRTIYVYFATKEDLVLSFLRRVVEGIREEIDRILGSDHSASEKLRQILYYRLHARIVGLTDYSQSMDQIFEGVRGRYIEQRQEFFLAECQIIADLLLTGQRTGDFEFTDATTVAKALLTATGAFLPYSMSVKEMGGLEAIEPNLRATVDLLVSGLRPNPSERK